MATRQYKAMAAAVATEGVQAALERLGGAFDIQIDSMPDRARDPEMTALLQMQAIKANLDRLADALVGLSGSDDELISPPALDLDAPPPETDPNAAPPVEDQPPTGADSPPPDAPAIPPILDPNVVAVFEDGRIGYDGPHSQIVIPPPPDDPPPTPDGESDDPDLEDDDPIEFGTVDDQQGLAATERHMKRTAKKKAGRK